METATTTQVGFSFIALGNLVASGMSTGFPAVALPALEQSEGTQLKPDQISWIASIAQLSMILGALAIGPIIDKWGRRFGFLISVISALIGWITVCLSQTIVWLYIGRLISGMSMGFTNAPTAVFLAEITSPSLRGPITVGKNIAFSLGVTLIYVTGLIFKDNWNYMALTASCLPGLILILTLVYLPESKVWEEQTIGAKTFSDFLKEYWERPEIYIPFNTMNLLFILRQLSGTSVILTYAINIVKTLGLKTNPYAVAIGLGLTRVLAGLIAAWLSKRYGRRKPVTFSGAVMSFTMICLAKNMDKWDNRHSVIPLAVLIVFIGSSTIFAAITQSINGEIFPTDVRGVCTGLTSCVMFMTIFLVLKTYPWLLNFLGKHNLFMLYASLCVSSTIASIMLLPETNGKTLQEIQAMFTKGKGKEVQSEMNSPLNDTEMKILSISS